LKAEQWGHRAAARIAGSPADRRDDWPARDNFTVDIVWKNGKLVSTVIHNFQL